MSTDKFIEYTTVKISSRNRKLYRKSTSKSTKPILYIKCKGVFITYKSYLKSCKNKYKGGGNIDNTIEEIANDFINYSVESGKQYNILDTENLSIDIIIYKILDKIGEINAALASQLSVDSNKGIITFNNRKTINITKNDNTFIVTLLHLNLK
jgi:hypothetical protein